MSDGQEPLKLLNIISLKASSINCAPLILNSFNFLAWLSCKNKSLIKWSVFLAVNQSWDTFAWASKFQTNLTGGWKHQVLFSKFSDKRWTDGRKSTWLALSRRRQLWPEVYALLNIVEYKLMISFLTFFLVSTLTRKH